MRSRARLPADAPETATGPGASCRRRSGSGDGLDLLLQFLERAAHDEAGGAPLHETGQRHRELDREVVVHARRRRTVGLRSGRCRRVAAACRLRRTATRTRPALRRSRTRARSGRSCRARRRGTRPCVPRPSASVSRIVTAFTSRTHSGYDSKSTATSQHRSAGASTRMRSFAVSVMSISLADLLGPTLVAPRCYRRRAGKTPWRAPQSPASPSGNIGTSIAERGWPRRWRARRRSTRRPHPTSDVGRESGADPERKNKLTTAMSSPRLDRTTASPNAQIQIGSDARNSAAHTPTANPSIGEPDRIEPGDDREQRQPTPTRPG